MAELSELLLKYKGRLEDVPRKAVIALASEVIAATPVDLGTLRGDWSLGIDAEPPDRAGTTLALDVAELASSVGSLSLGGVAKFYNQMPYAHRIEYEGWSQQAPAGMLWPAVKRWDLTVERIIRADSDL